MATQKLFPNEDISVSEPNESVGFVGVQSDGSIINEDIYRVIDEGKPFDLSDFIYSRTFTDVPKQSVEFGMDNLLVQPSSIIVRVDGVSTDSDTQVLLSSGVFRSNNDKKIASVTNPHQSFGNKTEYWSSSGLVEQDFTLEPFSESWDLSDTSLQLFFESSGTAVDTRLWIRGIEIEASGRPELVHKNLDLYLGAIPNKFCSFLRPDSDIDTGNAIRNDGGSPLFKALDEGFNNADSGPGKFISPNAVNNPSMNPQFGMGIESGVENIRPKFMQLKSEFGYFAVDELSPGFFAGSGEGITADRKDSNPIGETSWSEPNAIIANNDVYATTNIISNDVPSEWLRARNFGFDIPFDATIDGIQVSIRKLATGQDPGFIRDLELFLYNGVTLGNNKAKRENNWPSQEQIFLYGGNNDVWGADLAPDIVNDDTFGVVFAVSGTDDTIDADAKVDSIELTVIATPKNEFEDSDVNLSFITRQGDITLASTDVEKSQWAKLGTRTKFKSSWIDLRNISGIDLTNISTEIDFNATTEDGPGDPTDFFRFFNLDLEVCSDLGVLEDNVVLFTAGKAAEESGNIPLVMFTKDSVTSNMSLFTEAIGTAKSGVDLFIEGKRFGENMNLFLKTSDPLSAEPANFPLFTWSTTNSGVRDNMTLFLEGEGLSATQPVGNMNLYLEGIKKQSVTSQMNQFLKGPSTRRGKSFDLFLKNNFQAVASGVDLFLKAPSGTQGAVPISTNMNLFMARKANKIDRGMNLFIPGPSSVKDNMVLFLEGQPSESSGVNLFTEGADSVSQTETLYTHGF